MGRGNAKLVGFSSNREASVTLQDAIFDNLALAALTGNTIATGAKQIDKYEVKTLASGTGPWTVALAKAYTEITSVYILDEDGVTNKTLIDPADITESAANTIQLAADSGASGSDKVRVYYKVNTDATAKTVKVTSDAFGGTFKLVVDVMVRDAETGQDFYGQFIAKRAKIEDEFSFNFSPDGDPSVLDIPVEILRDPASQDMWELVIYDDDAIV